MSKSRRRPDKKSKAESHSGRYGQRCYYGHVTTPSLSGDDRVRARYQRRRVYSLAERSNGTGVTSPTAAGQWRAAFLLSTVDMLFSNR